MGFQVLVLGTSLGQGAFSLIPFYRTGLEPVTWSQAQEVTLSGLLEFAGFAITVHLLLLLFIEWLLLRTHKLRWTAQE